MTPLRQRLVVFGTLCTALFLTISLDSFSETVTARGARILAECVAEILRWFGTEPQVEGNRLLVPAADLRFAITNECVAAPAYATLVALELAVGRTVVGRTVAALAVCSCFLMVNVVRILSLSACWLCLPSAFEVLHVYAWNAALFVLVTSWVAVRLFRSPCATSAVGTKGTSDDAPHAS